MSSKIFIFMVTRASTPERASLLNSTINGVMKARPCADTHFYVAASGVGEPGRVVLDARRACKEIDYLKIYDKNVGQHVAWNGAMKHARAMEADYFLRIDDDVEFISKRWLDKLLRTSKLFNDEFVLSPTVRGLKNAINLSQMVTHKGIPLRFAQEAIGGICRWHPMALIKDYVSDVRLPLGSGDATGIAKYCVNHKIPMAYLSTVRVRHAKTTKGQEELDPGHFKNHSIYQHVPYIP